MSRILIESKNVYDPTNSVDTGYNHAYLIYDANDSADSNDIVLRGGIDTSTATIGMQISVPIEISEDARGSDSPQDRGSREITAENALDQWSIMVQVGNLIEAADIGYALPNSSMVHNSNSAIATMLHSIGLSILDFLPANATLEDLAGAENILDFERDLTGTNSNDMIVGWNQDDTLRGSGGNDTLNGGEGGDRLVGGDGSDRLIGGSGNDTYVITATDTGTDTITDDTGTLVIDGITVGGEFGSAAEGGLSSGIAVDPDGDGFYQLGGYSLVEESDGDLLLTNGTQSILLKNFQDGDYGIRLGADQLNQNDVVIANVLNDTPDRVIQYSNGAGGTIYQYESQPIPPWVTSYSFVSTTIVPGQAAVLIKAEDFTGTSGNDHYQLWALPTSRTLPDGDITISTGAGNDIIESNAGYTYAQDVYAGADRDFITTWGGKGSVHGDGGDDAFDLAGYSQLVAQTKIYGGDGHDTFNGYRAATIDGGNGIDTWTINAAWASGQHANLNVGAGTYAVSNTLINIAFTNIENFNVLSGSGNDTFLLGGGNDTVQTGLGYNTVDGGSGNDVIRTSGHDLIHGGDGNDSISALSYDQDPTEGSLYGDGGNDYIYAGTLNDLLYGGDGADTIDGNAGNDILVGENGADILQGGDGLDSIYGGALADSIDGGVGNDYIEGGDGDDLIVGGVGSDYIDGGNGIDTVSYSTSSAWVNVDLANNNHWSGDAAWDNIVNVENIIGSAYGDQLTGTTGVNVLTGGLGSDTISGLAGDDTLYGNAGDDVITAGDGDDLIIGGAGSDYIDGGNGIDTVSYAGSTTWVNVDLSGNNHWNGDAAWDNIMNVENIIGSDYSDQLVGDANANTLNGALGNDTLTGGGGNDVFYFAANSGADTVTDFHGAGTVVGDMIQIAGGSFGALSFSQNGANAIITHAGGTITLIGVNSASLTADDFSFA